MKIINGLTIIFNRFLIITGLLVATTLMTTAQAELTDLSSYEDTVEPTTAGAKWAQKPEFWRVMRHLSPSDFGCVYNDEEGFIESCEIDQFDMIFELWITKDGSVRRVQVIKSSGLDKIDKAFVSELRLARFTPFIDKGQAVEGLVTLPITYMNPFIY